MPKNKREEYGLNSISQKDYKNIIVETEYSILNKNDNTSFIDIFIVSPITGWSIIIENKIGSGEHGDQIQEYEGFHNGIKGKKNRVLVYMVTDKATEAPNENWIKISYEWLGKAIKIAIDQKMISEQTQVLLKNYQYQISDYVSDEFKSDFFVQDEKKLVKLGKKHTKIWQHEAFNKFWEVPLHEVLKFSYNDHEQEIIRELFKYEDMFYAMQSFTVADSLKDELENEGLTTFLTPQKTLRFTLCRFKLNEAQFSVNLKTKNHFTLKLWISPKLENSKCIKKTLVDWPRYDWQERDTKGNPIKIKETSLRSDFILEYGISTEDIEQKCKNYANKFAKVCDQVL